LGNWVHKDKVARGDEPDRAKVGATYKRRRERELAEVRMGAMSSGARWSCW
jgi:hypothetical protein